MTAVFLEQHNVMQRRIRHEEIGYQRQSILSSNDFAKIDKADSPSLAKKKKVALKALLQQAQYVDFDQDESPDMDDPVQIHENARPRLSLPGAISYHGKYIDKTNKFLDIGQMIDDADSKIDEANSKNSELTFSQIYGLGDTVIEFMRSNGFELAAIKEVERAQKTLQLMRVLALAIVKGKENALPSGTIYQLIPELHGINDEQPVNGNIMIGSCEADHQEIYEYEGLSITANHSENGIQTLVTMNSRNHAKVRLDTAGHIEIVNYPFETNMDRLFLESDNNLELVGRSGNRIFILFHKEEPLMDKLISLMQHSRDWRTTIPTIKEDHIFKSACVIMADKSFYSDLEGMYHDPGPKPGGSYINV
jgi:hypothetical protein